MKKKLIISMLSFLASATTFATDYSMKVKNSSSCSVTEIGFRAIDVPHGGCSGVMQTAALTTSGPITLPASSGGVMILNDVTAINTPSGPGWVPGGVSASAGFPGDSNWEFIYIKIGGITLAVFPPSGCYTGGTTDIQSTTCNTSGVLQASWTFDGAGNSIVTITD